MLKILVLIVAMLALTAWALRARGALLAQRSGRARLRREFSAFIEANRTRSLCEAEVEQFLKDTADADQLYSGGAVPRLRRDLHDQALRLSRLCVAAEEGWAGPARQGAIEAGCLEKRAWFARLAASVDAGFDSADAAESSLGGLCSIRIEQFNRLIRA